MRHAKRKMPGWGRMAAWCVVAALGGAGALGCSDHCGELPPCSPVFDIPTWCSENPGKCTTGGNATAGCFPGGPSGCQGADCTAGSFGVCSHLAVGITLRVPIAAFAGQLVGRQQLGVTQFSFFPGDPTHLHATLDGVPGAVLSPLPGNEIGAVAIAFAFSPFPASPMTLELSDSDPVSSNDEIEIVFMDYACFQANPRYPCPV